jgi:hypothetical protein
MALLLGILVGFLVIEVDYRPKRPAMHRPQKRGCIEQI